MEALYGRCVSRGESCSAERCYMRPTIPVPGRLGATFLSGSITVLLFGVMVSCQGGVLKPMLALLPMPALGGMICVNYLIWCILWIILYCFLGSQGSVSTLLVWTTIVPGGALLGSRMAEVSFA